MNLVEAVWKAKIKELYPSVTEFAAFSSIYILWTGVVIMVLTIVGTNIMRTRSWFTAAVITPIVILITGTLFFVLVVFICLPCLLLTTFFLYCLATYLYI